MYQYHCLNPIEEVGLKNFNGNYAKTDKIEDADAVLVRSAVMHDMDLPDSLVAVGQESFFADNRSSAITLDDLTKLPLIVYRRWEHLLRKEFEDKNLSANWFCINDDARTTLYFVEMGMGVGIIPQSAATLVQKKGIVCRPVKNCDIATDVVLAYNSTYLPECSRAFIEYLDTLYPDIP